MAERIQWSRQHPNPPEARYVGRGRGDYGKWGNPFAVKREGDEAQPWAVIDQRDGRVLAWWADYGEAIGHAVRLHRQAFYRHQLRVTPADARRELGGLDLGCWCRVGNLPCHGDTLLEAANP